MKASRVVTLVASALILAGALAGCTGSPSGESTAPASASPNPSTTPTGEATPSPTPTSAAPTIALPEDCREILSEDVLDQLGSTPLNDPVFGPSGVQDDGSLLCIWADPQADTTALRTTISAMSRGPALDMLNGLADTEGFACFTPDGGTRCEKTWPNEQYPVTDGRTVFWRDDILIDTIYSNLAPNGYTASIVEHLFD
jgi:hypothetical protein